MYIYGSFMNISDEKNKDIYVETLLHARKPNPERGYLWIFKK